MSVSPKVGISTAAAIPTGFDRATALKIETQGPVGNQVHRVLSARGTLLGAFLDYGKAVHFRDTVPMDKALK